MSTRLPPEFYARPALVVARELLGQILVHRERAGRIVEVEAYVGPHDLACHASKGLTARTEVIFGPPGRAYVYLIYGMYHCFNVVTDYDGYPSAVLVRAVEPIEGITSRTDGPGRLCRAMEITLAQNRADLQSDELHVLEAPQLSKRKLQRGPRIGVDYSGEWAVEPFRLWERDNPHVSRVPRSRK